MTSARPQRPLIVTYLAVVVIAGLAVLGYASAHLPQVWGSTDGTFVLLAVLLVVAERRPLTVQRWPRPEMVNLSGAFTCALLLQYHWSLAIMAQALASIVDDVLSDSARAHVPWSLRGFNVGQYCLSVGAAALVWDALSPQQLGDGASPAWVVSSLAACGAFFVVNTALPGVLFSLREGASVVRSLLAELPFQASVNGVVVAMAPLVVALAHENPYLVLLFLLPFWTVHRGAQSSLQREHMSRHDALTGLLNHLAFRDRLADELLVGVDGERHLAVMALSLDHFSDVRQTMGVAASDDLLVQVARRLEAAVPDGAVLGRSGDGGFLVAVPALRSPWEGSTCAEALLQQFDSAYTFEQSAFALTASLGLTISPLHGVDPDKLLQHAEVARDLAQRSRSGIEVYSDARNDFTVRRLAVLAELRPALKRREMVVCFQPQVDLDSRVITGYEALLRWTHPVLGVVAPDEFVPLAERAGLMREVTDYVLDEALRRAAEWRSAGSSATVSVNVSASVLQDRELPARVARRLAMWGVPSSALVLELTETAVMSHPARCHQVMSDLRELQVGLSLDDYGTGYASLAYLTTLPVYELKIYKSFVLGMADKRSDRVAVRSTLDLARELGMRVVAEGVETHELALMLGDYGCRTGQGYYFGRPAPAQNPTPDSVPDLTSEGLPAAR